MTPRLGSDRASMVGGKEAKHLFVIRNNVNGANTGQAHLHCLECLAQCPYDGSDNYP